MNGRRYIMERIHSVENMLNDAITEEDKKKEEYLQKLREYWLEELEKARS